MLDSEELQKKSAGAAKWSLATEVIVKIISPISQLILARLLAPEEFGMVATVTMVVNFADMFADAGFQKYLVQHSFRDKEDLHANANVAFWTNFGVSVVLWCLIAIFNDPVAAFVGNPSLGFPLAVACLSLPLTSFSSIQMALFHRSLDFKSLMPVRLASTLLNFGSTLALAFMGFGYWSLIVGTLAANVVNAVGLTLLSEWKPRFFYSFDLLKAMFSFSGWTLLESFTIWLSNLGRHLHRGPLPGCDRTWLLQDAHYFCEWVLQHHHERDDAHSVFIAFAPSVRSRGVRCLPAAFPVRGGAIPGAAFGRHIHLPRAARCPSLG